MAALSKILRSLLHVPEYLVPKPILDLAWKFDGAHGWARERVFQQWCEQQEFRQCFPDMFVFEVSKVKAQPGGLQTVEIGMFCPHELFTSFYEWRNGALFYSLFLGSPHDLEKYWGQPRNRELAIQSWGEAGSV